MTLHPAYEAAGVNNDLAIIRLSDPAPVGAERFDIHRDRDEVGQGVTLVGYGAPATGLGGLLPRSETPTKRGGSNRIDAVTDSLKGQPQAGVGWRIEPASQLALDFDDGTAAHDTLGRLLGVHDLGRGASEVFTSPGDSGGPLLIDGRISGLASYTFGRSLGSSGPDINGRTDSSFGEIASVVRVSHYAEWIDRTLRADLPDAPTRPEAVARRSPRATPTRRSPTSWSSWATRGQAGAASSSAPWTAPPGPGGLCRGERPAGALSRRKQRGDPGRGDRRHPRRGTRDVLPGGVRPAGGSFAAGLTRLQAMRTIQDDDGANPLLTAAIDRPGQATPAGMPSRSRASTRRRWTVPRMTPACRSGSGRPTAGGITAPSRRGSWARRSSRTGTAPTRGRGSWFRWLTATPSGANPSRKVSATGPPRCRRG